MSPATAQRDATPPTPNDPYLDWYLEAPPGLRILNVATERVSVLVEWKDPAFARTHLTANSPRTYKAVVPTICLEGFGKRPLRFWIVTLECKEALKSFIQDMGRYAERIELAAPAGAPGASIPATMPNPPAATGAKGSTLVAVFDDGCAFANRRFLTGGSARVLWLWNQDGGAPRWPLDGTSGPSAHCNFGHGGQWSRADLNGLMAAPDASPSSVYDAAGLSGLRRAAAHGPHVMDLLAGGAPDTPPDWDIVFVQFPKIGIDDPSGHWLARFVFEGLLYTLECRAPHTKHIVVNISWGPQDGPHDGSSFLERAIDYLVEVADALLGIELIVTVPAGNSFRSRAHAEFDLLQGRNSLQWIVPPDGETPSFLQIWWPGAVDPSLVNAWTTPPGQAAVQLTAGAHSATGWSWVLKRLGNSTVALLIVDPTEPKERKLPRVTGPAGAWGLRFDPVAAAASGSAHVYVARADHNMGARRRAKPSYLTDAALEASRFSAPRAYENADAPGSAIRSSGTMNGLATGKHTLVAAGYRYTNLTYATYSSKASATGRRPNFALMTDWSATVAGVRATAVRSGTTFRLVGTSTAAPQLGYALAYRLKPVPFCTPPACDPQRVGVGMLDPAPWLVHSR